MLQVRNLLAEFSPGSCSVISELAPIVMSLMDNLALIHPEWLVQEVSKDAWITHLIVYSFLDASIVKTLVDVCAFDLGVRSVELCLRLFDLSS